MLDLLQHFLTFRIQILSDIEVLILLLLLFLLLFNFFHLFRICFVQTENVIKVTTVNVHLFCLLLNISALD